MIISVKRSFEVRSNGIEQSGNLGFMKEEMKSQSNFTLRGKVAVVTGASRGLGRQIAKKLAEAGVRVALVSRNLNALQQVAQEIQSEGGEAFPFECDVRKEESVDRLRERVIHHFGRVHILVNNAGINIRKPLTEFPVAQWRDVLETNLYGAFLMCKAFVPYMRGQGYGRIINMTSILSHVALPGRTAYAASKAGLLGFTKALALELAADKITVNAVSPGPIATEMNAPIIQDPQLNKQFVSRIPLGRWGREEEVASLVLYLCRPEAEFITGTDILIDGGWTAQ